MTSVWRSTTEENPIITMRRVAGMATAVVVLARGLGFAKTSFRFHFPCARTIVRVCVHEKSETPFDGLTPITQTHLSASLHSRTYLDTVMTPRPALWGRPEC
jgi:hypothetical protein